MVTKRKHIRNLLGRFEKKIGTHHDVGAVLCGIWDLILLAGISIGTTHHLVKKPVDTLSKSIFLSTIIIMNVWNPSVSIIYP